MTNREKPIRNIGQLTISAIVATLFLLNNGALAQQAEGEAVCQEPGVTALAYGDHTVGCEIVPGADVDNLQFDGTTGERIRIIVHSTTTAIFDPRVELYDCGFALMEETSCSNNGCVATIDTELTCTGTHSILVSDLGGSEAGGYDLQLERLTPPHQQSLLAYDAVNSDSVSPGTDIDRFNFYGKVGTQVRATIHSTTAAIYDPRVEILDPTGQPVEDVTCSNNGCSVAAQFSPAIDGFYSLFVSDTGSSEAGGYNLAVQCIFGPCDSDGDGNPDPAPPLLDYDAPIGVTISPDVDMEFFSIDVIAGTTNRIAVHSTTTATLDPSLEVYDSSGAQVTTGTCSNNGCSFTVELTPSSDDRYTLLLSDSGSNEAGGLNINLQCLTGPCDSDGNNVADIDEAAAQFVFYDGSINESVSSDVDMVPLYFHGLAGSVVRIAVHSTGSAAFDPQIEIFDPDGAQALIQSCNNNGCAYDAELTLALDGVYSVFLSDVLVNEAGEFDFNMQCISGLCDSDADGLLDGDPTIIPVDIVISGEISPGVDVDQYAVLGEIGKTLRITVDSTTSAILDPQLELVAPSGAVVVNSCSNNGCAFTFDFTPAEAGLHQLIVSDAGTNEAGGYDMLVSCLFANCSAPPVAATDRDNCEWIANGPLLPDAGGNIQLDSDMDGYGNICDPDFDNDGVINFLDLLVTREQFFTAGPEADLDGSGLVNFVDLAIMQGLFFGPPGPSGLQCAGTIPCP